MKSFLTKLTLLTFVLSMGVFVNWSSPTWDVATASVTQYQFTSLPSSPLSAQSAAPPTNFYLANSEKDSLNILPLFSRAVSELYQSMQN